MVDTAPGNNAQGSSPREDLPPRRAVLLGASNIARGLSLVVDTARNAWGSPLDVLVASGHGRSYGMSSRVLGRRLPGILQCGLWEALRQRPAAPTAALITDIGNDVLYGASDEQISRWIEQCLEPLRPICDRIVLTRLPVDSVGKLGSARYLLIRTILFPKSRLTLEGAIETTHKLNDRVAELARRYDARLFEPAPEWYGFDPIHVKHRYKQLAWQQLFAGWCKEELPEPAQHSFARYLRLRRVRPQQRHLFGIEQRQAQPAHQLDDGSLLSLF